MSQKFFATAIFLISAIGFSQDQALEKKRQAAKKDLCEYGSVGVEKTYTPENYPTFFFRYFEHKGKKYFSYAGDKVLFLYDIESGKEYQFHGRYDPVPVGNGIISVPFQYEDSGTHDKRKSRLVFYDIDEILKGNQTPQPIRVQHDEPLRGEYQSVGVLDENEKGRRVRIITDGRDLTKSEEPAVMGAEYLIGKDKTISLISKPRSLCSNVKIKMPMISKDGRHISGFEVVDDRKAKNKQSDTVGTNQIWEINNNGTCTSRYTFPYGYEIGKADFSFDGNQIAFSSKSEGTAQHYVNTGAALTNMNIFVYDFSDKTIRKMTQNSAFDNSYFPSFKPDGKIVYTHVTAQGRAKFVEADPQQGKKVRLDFYDQDEKELDALFAVGQVWSRVCLNYVGTKMTSLTGALSADPEKCRKLAAEFWEQYKNETVNEFKIQSLKKLTLKDLQAACPQEKNEKTKDGQSSDIENNFPKGELLIAKKCAVCHPGWAYSGQAKPSIIKTMKEGFVTNEFRFRDEILRRIRATGQDKMPRNSSLTEEEKRVIEDYLKSLPDQVIEKKADEK